MGKKPEMLFIINPRSGRGTIKNRLLEVLDYFSSEGWAVEVYVTQAAMDAASAAETGGKYDLIVCSGGDGTLNEVISGMMRLDNPPPLGYIPAGSTNDFASGLKLPKNIRKSAQCALKGKTISIDIGRFCRDRYFVYVAGFGAFTEVSYLTSQERKNLLGHPAYMIEGVKSLPAIKPYYMRIETEKDTIEGEFILGMVTNAVQIGGIRGLVGQKVVMDDGLYEVLLIRGPKSPGDLSDILASLIRAEENSMVCRMKCARLRAVSTEPVDWVIDGEYGGRRHEVEIENLSRRISIRGGMTKVSSKEDVEK